MFMALNQILNTTLVLDIYHTAIAADNIQNEWEQFFRYAGVQLY